jgi:translation elongation factor EF-Ts
MAAITAKMVSYLRSQTNESMMECKMALIKHDGDMKAALDYIMTTPLHIRNKGKLDGRECCCCQCKCRG